jgi:predicted RNA binding protein YcfA (HicA-like mRNA interferase family)
LCAHIGAQQAGGKQIPAIEHNRAKVLRRLMRDGWQLLRHDKEHDIYLHPEKVEVIALPRHRKLSPGVAQAIAKSAGWQ